MSNRIEAIRGILRDLKLDGIVVTKNQNWYYLSGFTGSNAVLIITADDNLLVTDFRYLEQAAAEAGGFRIIKPLAFVEDAVADEITKLGLKRLGFEDENMPYRIYSSYGDKLPGVELVPLGQSLEKIRWVKDEREVAALRKAAAITDDAFDHIVDFIKPGVREAEIALEIEYFMKKKGAQRAAFEIIVASGPRAALPHGVASQKIISGGEFVVLDFGAVYDGYHADMTRTVITGRPDEKQRQIYDLVLRAQEKAIEAIKPGVKCCVVDLAARDMITVEGYGANFGHGLGHSVGLEIHEKPSFTPRDETILEPGMVITVEPGVYLSGWGGVRIEDLIHVTNDGYEILSKSPKYLRGGLRT